MPELTRRVAHLVMPLLVVVAAVAGCQRPVVGTLDAVLDATAVPSGVRLVGWAWDRNGAAPVTLHVYVDARRVTVARTNLWRPDVGAPVPSGYDLTVAVDPGTHDVCVRALDTGGDEGLIGCRRVQVGGFPAGLTADVAYGADPAQRLDVYRPDTPATGLPALVWIHGGGFIGGDKGAPHPDLLRYVTRGDAVLVAVEYRLASLGGQHFPVPVQDVKQAVRWIKANATKLGVDPDRIVASGESAGGNLALMLGATGSGQFEPVGLAPDLAAHSSRVTAVVDLVGPTDLTNWWAAPHPWPAWMESEYLGCPRDAGGGLQCPAGLMRQASVAPWVGADVPPAFLGYGELDDAVPHATQGRPLVTAWSAARGGRDVTYVTYPGQGHSLSLTADPRFDAFMDAVLTSGASATS